MLRSNGEKDRYSFCVPGPDKEFGDRRTRSAADRRHRTRSWWWKSSWTRRTGLGNALGDRLFQSIEQKCSKVWILVPCMAKGFVFFFLEFWSLVPLNPSPAPSDVANITILTNMCVGKSNVKDVYMRTNGRKKVTKNPCEGRTGRSSLLPTTLLVMENPLNLIPTAYRASEIPWGVTLGLNLSLSQNVNPRPLASENQRSVHWSTATSK